MTSLLRRLDTDRARRHWGRVPGLRVVVGLLDLVGELWAVSMMPRRGPMCLGCAWGGVE